MSSLSATSTIYLVVAFCVSSVFGNYENSYANLIIGTWECPMSFDRNSNKKVKMIFRINGVLFFENGYAPFSPARWKYDEKENILVILLPRIIKGYKAVLEEQMQRGEIIKFDLKNHAIYYRIDKEKMRIDFGGYLFYKQ